MFWRQWRGSEQASTKRVTLARGLFWAEGNQDVADSRRLLPPLPPPFFKCGPLLKSLLNLLEYCFCFVFWFSGCEACGWDLSPLIRVWTCTPCTERPIKRARTRGNLHLKNLLCIKGKYAITRHLLLVLSCEWPAPTLKPQASVQLFLSSGWPKSINRPTCSWVLLSL